MEGGEPRPGPRPGERWLQASQATSFSLHSFPPLFPPKSRPPRFIPGSPPRQSLPLPWRPQSFFDGHRAESTAGMGQPGECPHPAPRHHQGVHRVVLGSLPRAEPASDSGRGAPILPAWSPALGFPCEGPSRPLAGLGARQGPRVQGSEGWVSEGGAVLPSGGVGAAYRTPGPLGNGSALGLGCLSSGSGLRRPGFCAHSCTQWCSLNVDGRRGGWTQDVGLWCQAVGELWPLHLHPALVQKPP